MSALVPYSHASGYPSQYPMALREAPPVGERVKLDTEEKILTVFGKSFCDEIGVENLMKMPQVSLKSEQDVQNLLSSNVPFTDVDVLQEFNAVKGVSGKGFGFVLFRVNHWLQTEKKNV